jgi:hypothetical protein
MVFIECPKHGLDLLLGFSKVKKYPYKFQKICYGTQRTYGIPYKGYCKCIE